MLAQNNLTKIRQKSGLSAADLAAQVGIKRQTIYAIEAGSYIPNTVVALKLAKALDVSVEDLFSIEKEPQTLQPCQRVDLLVRNRGEIVQRSQPVRLCRVDKHIVAVPSSPIPTGLPAADGVVLKVYRSHRAIVQPLNQEAIDPKGLVVAGCDPGMSVLARQLNRYGDIQLIVAGCSSSQALRWLKQKRIHVAGTHLRDEATGESNLPAVKNLFPRGGYRVVTFANWEEGLVVARGNPKRIRNAEHLSRNDLTWVNREPGAGSRFLLDSLLQTHGIAAETVRGYERIAFGHISAAWRVLRGEVDCCIAVRAAAQVFGLGFIPLLSERYDLIIPEPYLGLQTVQIMLDVMNHSSLKRDLEALGGYDTSQTGRMLV
jgi:putative molybdopterin biosynthesis protein